MNKTKKSIFEAAIKVISQSGYNGATMDDIAISAGVAKGTLYYHFKSKEEIFKYVISEGVNVLIEEMNGVAQQESNPIDKLMALCRSQLRMVYRNKDLFKVIMSQLWGEELRQQELREIIKLYILQIEKYLKEAMEAGLLKKGETTFMAYTFFGALCSGAVYEIINEDQREIDEIIENITTYILKGIEA